MGSKAALSTEPICLLHQLGSLSGKRLRAQKVSDLEVGLEAMNPRWPHISHNHVETNQERWQREFWQSLAQSTIYLWEKVSPLWPLQELRLLQVMKSVPKFLPLLHTPWFMISQSSSPTNGHSGLSYPSPASILKKGLHKLISWEENYLNKLHCTLPLREIYILMRKIVATIKSSAKELSNVSS